MVDNMIPLQIFTSPAAAHLAAEALPAQEAPADGVTATQTSPGDTPTHVGG